MLIGNLLNMLDKATPKGRDHWMARCPAHKDDTPSLSIDRKNGKILLKCFSGCDADAIVSAIGITTADLFEAAKSPAKREPATEIVATYDYVDEAGKVLYQVVRYRPKSFRQRRPDGKGGWSWNMDGVTRVLYHLNEVVKADMVYLVEGEKDADNLRLHGLTATTSPGGAQAWKDEYAAPLAGKKVVIIPDQDGPGLAYGRLAAVSAQKVTADVRVIMLPSPSKDTTDWLDAGGKPADLPAMAGDIAQLSKSVEQTVESYLDWQLSPGPRGLSLAWGELSIKIAALEEYSHGIHGEITCRLGGKALLQYETVNFSSSANIDKMEKKVRQLCDNHKLGDGIDWETVWADVRVKTIEYYRRGEPTESCWTNEDIAKPEYLIWPFIPRGQTTIFFAEPESFKSGFGLLFHGMVNLSWTDHPKLGIRLNLPPEGGSSLYLDNETRRNDALWQLKRIAMGFGVEFPFEYRRLRRPVADEAEQIRERCDDLGVNFLVIDSLMRAAGGDVLKTETVNRMFDALDYLGRTTLIMAHSPKAVEGEKTIYGNAFFQYLPRSVWELKRIKDVDSDTMDVGFFHTKGNLSKKFPPKGYRLKFVEDGPITISPIAIADTDLSMYMDLGHRILNLLKDGRPRSYQTIAEELAVKPKGVADQLSRLNRREQVTNIGGSWILRTDQKQ